MIQKTLLGGLSSKLISKKLVNEKRGYSRSHDLLSLMRQLIEIISVTSEYPQDGGWSVLLLRLLRLRATKDMWCTAPCA